MTTDYLEIIDSYNELRERITMIIRMEPSLMGADEWLLFAIQDSDITLSHDADGIRCFGHTYTMQTMGNEWFEFTIPFDYFQED